MIKLRESHYCNLKLLLIFLVIYGHMIEPQIQKSQLFLTQYRIIYLVHMPLFAFLSGLFIKNSRGCAVQLEKLLPIYLVLQLSAVLFGGTKVSLTTPYWHLWYLLSCSCWCMFAWFWFSLAKSRGGYVILLLSIAAGCFTGFADTIGREYSLSRTIVFFPYFWLGILCDRNIRWYRLRAAGAASLLAALLLLTFTADRLTPSFLYQARAYRNPQSDVFLRLCCYLCAALMGFFLLTFAPIRCCRFTKAGVNTMPAYLLHAPVVLLLRQHDWSFPACVIISVFLLWLIYQLLHRCYTRYDIIVPERRNRSCLHFRTFT